MARKNVGTNVPPKKTTITFFVFMISIKLTLFISVKIYICIIHSQWQPINTYWEDCDFHL